MPTHNSIAIRLEPDKDLFAAIRFLIDTEIIGGAGNIRAFYVSSDERLRGFTVRISLTAQMQITLCFAEDDANHQPGDLWITYDTPPEVHYGA